MSTWIQNPYAGGGAPGGAAGGALYGTYPNPQFGDYTPQDYGFFGWAYDPTIACSSSNALTSGQIVGVRIKVPACTISNLWVALNSSGTGLTAGQNFAGLYSGDGTTLLSATGDQTTNWGTTSFNALSMALTTPQAVAQGFVYVAWYANNTAGSNPKFQYQGASAMSNANLSAVTPTTRYIFGGTGRTTSLPASLTISSSGDTYWAAVN